MLTGRHILVVDDDPGIRNLLNITFSSERATVRTAAHGADALEAIGAHERFDLIVLDLSMPVMDGRACFRALRELPCDTPVLLLSAYGAASAQLELGAEGAMDKPFDPLALVELALQLLS